MGWRTDQAYEDEQRREYRDWKASLSWKDYGRWLWRRWGAFLAGVATTGAVIALAALLLKLAPFSIG
ncbi:hypothetical protein [Shinella sp.]|uniref:hypothetical protein n=1 Tax=Shinella sp. TaxID=1870904 RepID=UPI0025834A4F|nr:hypothetical protein [Shinella sp.]MCW5712314.1 hypothetical protein [Shinella sp.]